MSTAKRLSPTAELLRQSRLFSMPPALKAPPVPSKSGIPPHPLRQAITTPQSTRDRGEWGLKRDLPGKRTKVNTLYVSDIDNIDHFTRFNTAESDTTFLKRWQEIDVPISMPPKGFFTSETAVAFKKDSAFEENTAGTAQSQSQVQRKWKYDGPHLKSMGPAELAEYIKKEVIPRRGEFAEHAKRKMRQWNHDEGIGNNELGGIWAEDVSEPNKLTHAQVAELRNEKNVLNSLTSEFLDLPADAPSKTHPSGGLYYIRSAAHMHNDVVTGPMVDGKRMPARRVVAGRTTGHRSQYVGLGGVVARCNDGIGQALIGDELEVSVDSACFSPDGKLMVEVKHTVPHTLADDDTAVSSSADRNQQWATMQKAWGRDPVSARTIKNGIESFLNKTKDKGVGAMFSRRV